MSVHNRHVYNKIINVYKRINYYNKLQCRFISTDNDNANLWDDELTEPLKYSLSNLYDCEDYNEYLILRVREFMKLTPENLDKKPFFLIQLLQESLSTIHYTTGLPWWFIISSFTIVLKLAMLPIWACAERNRRNNAVIMPLVMQMQNKLLEEKKKNNYQSMLKTQTELFQLMSEKNIVKNSILQGISSFLQFATFFWVYTTQRSLCKQSDIAPDFISESPLWLDSIALPDPYYILPTISATLLLKIYYHNISTRRAIKDKHSPVKTEEQTEASKREKVMAFLSKFAIYSFILISYNMPAGAFLYLAPSLGFHALLRLATRNDAFCRFFQLGKVIN